MHRHVAWGCAPGTGPSPLLCRNNYNVDLYQGPVLAPLRATGLAGAYAGIAEGVDGLGENLAASAVRSPFSTKEVELDATAGISLPGAFGNTDFDNRGSGTLSANASAIFGTLGGMVQWGRFGVGLLMDAQRYTTLAPPGSTSAPARVTLVRGHLGFGYALDDHQLVLAAGLRGVSVLVDESTPSLVGTVLANNVLLMTGFAPEVSFLARPDFLPWRLGLTYRMPVIASNNLQSSQLTHTDGVYRANGLAVPQAVNLPWELEAGFALSVGPRPLNPSWIDPEKHERRAREDMERLRAMRASARQVELDAIADPILRAARAAELDSVEARLRQDDEHALNDTLQELQQERSDRYSNWPRERILIVFDLLVTGTTPNGISLLSFVRQEDIPSGQRVSVQPRLGMESEPIPDRLSARVGTYLEPSRYNVPLDSSIVSGARQHFTLGFDVKLFRWNIFGLFPNPWQFSFAGDLAPRYTNLSIGIGVWH